MVFTFKDWLRETFRGIVSVQGTSIRHPSADVAVLTWTGVKIHVHLIDQPVTTRAIKRTLQQNSDVGINTLFMVSAHILPEDGTRIPSKDWMIALQTLNNERIYAYRIRDGRPEVIQVHLEETRGIASTDYRVWYGPTVDFSRLRYFRKSIKLRSVKGDWLIADFGSPAFWKNTDYRAGRERQQRPPGTHTYWQTWSAGTTWDGPYERPQEERRSSETFGDHLHHCYQLLGVNQGASEAEVKRAYRQRALDYHPDTSSLPEDQATVKFKALTAAYAYIKSANGWS
jgi:hypothetical protein